MRCDRESHFLCSEMTVVYSLCVRVERVRVHRKQRGLYYNLFTVK